MCISQYYLNIYYFNEDIIRKEYHTNLKPILEQRKFIMKKLTFIGSVMLSVICLIFTHSYAETYHKFSDQYKICVQNESLSSKERINCFDDESKRILTSITNDLRQFNNLECVPKEIRNNLITQVDHWFKYEKLRIRNELIVAQHKGGIYQAMPVLHEQVERTLYMQDWFTNIMKDFKSIFCN